MPAMLRLITAAAVLITASSAAFAAEDCTSERSIKSADSDKETKVQFKNASKSKIKVFWINYDGKREFYSDVAPGKSYTQDTYMTHPWVVTDMTGQCVVLFRPLPGATVATINSVD
jgi:hypothetical protein